MDTLLTSYVVERALPINNGERTVLHDSNMQDFLLKFGFRRHYCRLNIIYSSPLHHVVNLVYPFRSLVQHSPNIRCLLKSRPCWCRNPTAGALSRRRPAERRVPWNWGNRSRTRWTNTSCTS